MKYLRAFFARLSGLFSKNSHDVEFNQELESHLQMHIDDNLRSGMSPEEARRQALIKFGSIETAKESVRESSRLLWLETAWQDMRYALRGLRLNPGFATTAILSLALGIGSAVAIFTVADNVLLRPLPYPQPSQLVMLWEVNQRNNNRHNVVAPADYFDWKSQSNAFSGIAAFRNSHVIFSDHGRAEEIDVESASSELLPLLGAQPVHGRLFTGEEEQSLARVAVISYRLWQRWFGGDEGTIGRQVQIGARPWVIVGVLPPNFYFHSRSIDLWVPFGIRPADNLRTTSGRYMMTVARLKPGVTVREAQAQMSGIAQRLEIAYPGFNKYWGVNVEPLRESLIGEVKTSLLVLLGAVILLLGVACANVANLLLARYTVRRREMAVREALGAARLRLIRQVLTESIVLGSMGGLLGLLLARFAVAGLIAFAPKDLVRSIEVSFDLRIVIFALGLSLLTGIIFGLAPAFMSPADNLSRALHEESRTSSGRGNRLRRWLVIGEIACSVALLAVSGLLFRTLVGLQKVDPGLNASNLLTFRVTLPRNRYQEVSKRTQFFERATQQIAALPGIQSASAVDYLPFNGLASGTTINIQGRPPAKVGEELSSVIRSVLPGYFRTMGIPLKRGRDFNNGDDLESAPHRFIVNEAFVRKYMRADEDPIGQQINAIMEDKNPFGEIIGVVGDVKEGSLEQEPKPTIYYPHVHLGASSMVFVARTAGDPMAVAGPVRKAIHEVDPEQPIADTRSMETVLAETFARQQFSAMLLAGFSFASLLLAAIGIYGVLSYSVTQRTREIGVRVALGAEPASIIRMVVGSGARLVMAGVIAGLAGALAVSGLVKSLLFGVGPRDPVSFVLAPVGLSLIALFAAYLPARRAAQVSPMEALRTE